MLDSGDAAGHIHSAPSRANGDEENPFTATPELPLTLRPGGAHAMLMGLKRPLSIGETFDMTVVLKSGREVQVEVLVAANSPINPSS
jgi:copper(I)-binding protein